MREVDLYDAGFDATWELDIFGRLRRSVEQATALLQAAEEQRRGVLVMVIAEVARNYVELRGLQQQLRIARMNVTNAQETLDLVQKKLEAGLARQLDIERARSQLEATQAAIPMLEAAIKSTIYRISVLTGQAPTALEEELEKTKPLPQVQHPVKIGSPAEWLRRRPDIRAAERQLAAATAGIGVAVADLFPRVTFIGSIGFNAKDLVKLGEAGSDTYTFGPHISWAAFDLGRVYARIQAAKAEAKAALATYEKTVLTALEETEGALVRYGRAQRQTAHLAAAVQAAEKAYDLARQQYDHGLVDFLVVLDAQRNLLNLRSQWVESQRQTAVALVAVYKALGGGWQIELPKSQSPESSQSS